MKQVKTNFCLFMPLYDYIYGTADPASDELFAKARRYSLSGALASSLMLFAFRAAPLHAWRRPNLLQSQGREREWRALTRHILLSCSSLQAKAGAAVPDRTPEAVFVGHGTEVLSVWHVPFMLRSFTVRICEGKAFSPWAQIAPGDRSASALQPPCDAPRAAPHAALRLMMALLLMFPLMAPPARPLCTSAASFTPRQAHPVADAPLCPLDPLPSRPSRTRTTPRSGCTSSGR